jgi:hypothetical protein
VKVFDAFPFFNELDLLRVRLVEHDPFVDRFILIEADRTHTGRPKPYYFDQTDPRFAPFAGKIIHRSVALQESPANAWVNENAQRDAILNAANFADDDVLFISDADEFLSRRHWLDLLRRVQVEGVVGVRQTMYYYQINLLAGDDWNRARLCTFGHLRCERLTPTQLRLAQVPITSQPCGWHFSYIGDVAAIRRKIEAFAHQEYNHPQWNSEAAIRQALEQHVDLFQRGEQFARVRIDESWPLEMLQNPLWARFTCSPLPLPVRVLNRLRRWGAHMGRLWNGKVAEVPPPDASDQAANLGSVPATLLDRMLAARNVDDDEAAWTETVRRLHDALGRLDGWITHAEAVELFECLTGYCSENGTIVEIGSWKGRSSVVCSHAAHWRGATLFCVDHWAGNLSEGVNHPTVSMARQENIFALFEANMQRFGYPNFRALRGDSVAIGQNWQRSRLIDVLFLDAATDFGSVLANLQTWTPHLRMGGIVCGINWNADERPKLGGSVRRAFQAHFSCETPNVRLHGCFWAHRPAASG